MAQATAPLLDSTIADNPAVSPCLLLTDAVEKGLVIFGEQWFRLLRLLAAEVCHDGPTEGRSEPAFLSV
jgi:hypothetical protein